MKTAAEAAEHWVAARERASVDWARAISGRSATRMTEAELREKTRELLRIVNATWDMALA